MGGPALDHLGGAQARSPEWAQRLGGRQAAGAPGAHELAHPGGADDDRTAPEPVDDQVAVGLGGQGGQGGVRGIGRQAPPVGGADAPGPQQALPVHGLEGDAAVLLRPGPAQAGDPGEGRGWAPPPRWGQ